jgi:hypothetical protein
MAQVVECLPNKHKTLTPNPAIARGMGEDYFILVVPLKAEIIE